MYLENARTLFQGVMVLLFSAVARWIDLSLGLVLIPLMGLVIAQSAFTGFCPADLLLRQLGIERKHD